jgi:sulfur carrier protein
VRILLNDEPRDTEAVTLGDLLVTLGLAAEPGVAAAVDGAVVPRSAWTATSLAPGASVLVIRAAQGG